MRTQNGFSRIDNTLGHSEREWRILQALRFRGALPKADLSRLTGINKQTVSVLVDKLLSNGWVVAQAPVHGKYGRPPMPVALCPGAACSIGVRLGWRGFEIVAIDALGRISSRESRRYERLEPEALQADLRAHARTFGERSQQGNGRVAGTGVAVPLWLEKGASAVRKVLGLVERFSAVDLHGLFQGTGGGPVELVPEAVAACCAELVTGWGREFRNFLYLHIGTFLGAGLVLEGRLYTGPGGRAGAIGLLNSGLDEQPGGESLRLHEASGLNLRQVLAESNGHLEPEKAASYPQSVDPATLRWIEGAAPALARTCHFATCLLELEGIVIDGSLPTPVIQELVWRVETEMEHRRWQGMKPPSVELGRVGPEARIIGAALLPLYRWFMPQLEA
ncbi:MAG TPA: ROK family transcriptional regulator [Anaeromyxobacter sp.]|nr:ROK family transcriptional regulator [Anaeromyxobacter sp.]